MLITKDHVGRKVRGNWVDDIAIKILAVGDINFFGQWVDEEGVLHESAYSRDGWQLVEEPKPVVKPSEVINRKLAGKIFYYDNEKDQNFHTLMNYTNDFKGAILDFLDDHKEVFK